MRINLNSYKYSITIIFLICISALIGIFSVWDIPLYSDSAFHAANIREIVTKGSFPVYSAIGWVVPDMNPLSFPPILTHPPLFYVINAFLVILGMDIVSALTLLAIIPTALTVYFLFRLIQSFFSTRVAIFSAFLFVFTPMNIWLESHRIMEPTQYLLSVCSYLYMKRFTQDEKISNLILAAIFSAGVLYIKITSLFIVLAACAYLIFKRLHWKYTLIFCTLLFLLYSPYLYFSLKTRGSISYAPPGLPIIDKYVFKPWWNWDKSPDEKNLDAESNETYLMDKLVNYDLNNRDYIQKDFFNFNFLGVLQNYNVFSIIEDSNRHWFSPYKVFDGFFFILFILGLVFYLRKHRSNDYNLIVIPLFIIITIYLTKAGELRYFFILNILLIVAYSITLSELTKNYRWTRTLIIPLLTFSLIYTTYSEIQHSHLYKNSLRHNPLPEGYGVVELQKIDRNLISDSSENIFTPATSDVGYYLNRRAVADHRLYFVSEESVKKYLDMYNVSVIIVPTFFVYDTFYSQLEQAKVPNTVANWEGTTIPIDSNFYKYITDKNQVNLVHQYNAFKVYKRKAI